MFLNKIYINHRNIACIMKGGECIPEETIKKISQQTKLPAHKIFHKICYHAPEIAIKEDHYRKVLKLLKDKKKHIVVETAPSIRVSIGEEFGLEPGTIVLGKMVAALRECGFTKIFDTNLGADIMVVEEATELLQRIKKKGPFPMITTCCPAWIRFMEHFYHDLIPNMSTCKSPHEMLGVLARHYYADKYNVDKRNMVVVSIMPCTAKRYESQRPELKSGVDYVLTTREAARLIKHFKIDFNRLDDDAFDPALGISTGAAAIFAATGGVMEAAIRTAYELATGKPIKNLAFKEMRGMKGLKHGTVNINGMELKCAAVNGLSNARRLLRNAKDYHFIEIMACPGGCIGGEGQPLPRTKQKIQKRIEALYMQDADLPVRKSHENPLVRKIYKEFLGKPGSPRARNLLHSSYIKRKF
jgi:NADP-reducing hydrogenase subunit HndD